MWWHHDWSGWNWFFMVLAMALFWAVVLGGIILATRGASRSEPRRPERNARELLDERFARGEITEDEYRRSRDVLSEP